MRIAYKNIQKPPIMDFLSVHDWGYSSKLDFIQFVFSGLLIIEKRANHNHQMVPINFETILSYYEKS